MTSEARLEELARLLANHPFLAMAVDEINSLEQESAEGYAELKLLRERVGELEQTLTNINMWIPASIQEMTVEQLVIWLLAERALTGETSVIPDSVPLKDEAMKRYELVHGEEGS